MGAAQDDFIAKQDIGTEFECATCGYNKWDIGLEFHHVKDGHMLLCAPCHRSYHPEFRERSKNGQTFEILQKKATVFDYALRSTKCYRDNLGLLVRLYKRPFHFLERDCYAALQWFQERGGFCDCEAHLNVVLKYMRQKKTRDIIHLAPGFEPAKKGDIS